MASSSMSSSSDSSSPSSSAFNIQGCVALVTGTNKTNGIGAHLVRALVEEGAAKVYATARNTQQVDYLVQELIGYGNGKVVVPVPLDVTDWKAIQELPAKLPDVTLLINNAGFVKVGNTSLGSFEIARKEMEVNYFAPMALVQSFAPLLKAFSATKKQTAVMNIASIGSYMNFFLAATYSPTKAALHSLTQAQRRDLPQSLVMGVYPATIDTDMAKELPEPKASSRDVALAVMQALKNGDEDVFPDPLSQQLIAGWRADAKAMEKHITAMAKGPVSVSK